MSFFSDALHTLHDAGLYRSLRLVDGMQDAEVTLNGKRVVMLSSNNYLGLANDTRLARAAIRAIEQYGLGSGASRLISGNMTLHEKLEKKLAGFKGTDDALVFNSGYHANVGVIAALMGPDDHIFSDALNHASVIDGCRLSKAATHVYHHADMESLEAALKKTPATGKRLIVTDTVFSMDGDIAPLQEIVDLARDYECLTMIDEAHATGVLGRTGRGVAELLGVADDIDIQMGTLGKALGTFGAYIAGAHDVIDYFRNRARTFVFTTALPPAICAAALEAVTIVETEPERRETLAHHEEFLSRALTKMDYCVSPSITPVIPVIIGPPDTTMRVCETLLHHGVYAQGIRPPTVPDGTSRLRVTVMATHTQEHLDRAVAAFEHACAIVQ